MRREGVCVWCRGGGKEWERVYEGKWKGAGKVIGGVGCAYTCQAVDMDKEGQ